MRVVRRVGIAMGSLVIAFVAVSLVAGIAFGPAADRNPLIGIVVIVIGGLVYADIVRRERLRASVVAPPIA